jgi:hypothetical protein
VTGTGVVATAFSIGNLTITGNGTYTGKQTFIGNSSSFGITLFNALEDLTITAAAATGTINYDLTTQTIIYYTTNATANWTINFRASSGTSLNTAMTTGESVTAVFIAPQGATAYYNNIITVDGVSVTPKWQGSSGISSGHVNSTDIYSYSIIKTGSAAFTIFASQTQFI